jgi:hypothetical protein
MRRIAASWKTTDRRDAYWIAKTLQTGMRPHPVYIRSPAARSASCGALLSQAGRSVSATDRISTAT